MKTFSEDVRRLAAFASNGYCWAIDCTNKGQDYHHRVPNTIGNNKSFPYFIHSIFNCTFLCRNCHTNRLHQFDVAPAMAQAYEFYLKQQIGGVA